MSAVETFLYKKENGYCLSSTKPKIFNKLNPFVKLENSSLDDLMDITAEHRVNICIVEISEIPLMPTDEIRFCVLEYNSLGFVSALLLEILVTT